MYVIDASMIRLLRLPNRLLTLCVKSYKFNLSGRELKHKRMLDKKRQYFE